MPDFANYDVVIGGRTKIGGSTSIEGDTYIKGATLETGCLKIADSNPESQFSYEANTYFDEEIELHSLNGTYGSYSFDYIKLTRTPSQQGPITIITNKLQLGRNDNIFYTNSKIEARGYLLDYDLEFEVIFPTNSKTFLLKDLPTVNPGVKNCVWNDNGILKIVT